MQMHAKNTSTQQNTCVSDCPWHGFQKGINQQSTINNQQSQSQSTQHNSTTAPDKPQPIPSKIIRNGAVRQ
jgi:hypothetical protein